MGDIYIYIYIYICKNYSNITWITNDFDGELKGESIHIPTEQEGIIVNSNYIYTYVEFYHTKPLYCCGWITI